MVCNSHNHSIISLAQLLLEGDAINLLDILRVCIRIVDRGLNTVALKFLHNVHNLGVAYVCHILLEGNSKNQDLGTLDGPSALDQFLYHLLADISSHQPVKFLTYVPLYLLRLLRLPLPEHLTGTEILPPICLFPVVKRADKFQHPSSLCTLSLQQRLLELHPGMCHAAQVGAVDHLFVKDAGCLPRVHALPAQLVRLHCQKTASKAAPKGIHDMYETVFVAFHKLRRGSFCCIEGAADPGAHHNADHVGPLRQNRLKIT